jgi:hypothetical protein
LHSPEFWAGIVERLTPLIGVPQEALGSRWMDILASNFTRYDYVAVEAINRHASLPEWYLVQIHPNAERLCIDHFCQSAQSMQEALAHVMQRCAMTRTMPDSALLSEDAQRLELRRYGEPWVTIARLRAIKVTEQLFARGLGTLTCARRAGDPYDEILKRLKRWPGLSALELEPRTTSRGNKPFLHNEHLAIPKEWLLSARRICKLAGKEQSTNLAQKVAAAALDAPSWNHLASPHGDLSPELVTPWALYKTPSRESPIACYRNPFDGIADLASRFATLTDKWNRIVFEDPGGAARYCEYSFRSRPMSNAPHEADGSEPAICLTAIECVPEVDYSFLQKAAIALSSGSGTDILELFGGQLNHSERAIHDDALNSEQHLVTDSGWRFTLRGETETAKPQLRAWRLDGHGQAIFDTCVPIYKGLLLYYSDLNAHVLSSDYDGASPRALIRNLSKPSVKVIQTVLNETRPRTMTRDALGERDRNALDRLIAEEKHANS